MKFNYHVFDVNMGLLYLLKHGASSPGSTIYRGYHYVYLISHPSVKVIPPHKGVGVYPSNSEIKVFSSDLAAKVSSGVYTGFEYGPKNYSLSSAYLQALAFVSASYVEADLR